MNAEAEALRFQKLAGAHRPDCVLWTGSLTTEGYPILRHAGKRTIYAHRWAWEQANGPLGDLTIDHLCFVRCCVNLAHLEAVPESVNRERKEDRKGDLCKYGHPFDRLNRHGHRVCSKCTTRRHRERYYRLHPGAVPMKERTHCPNGHAYTPENLVYRADSPQHRRCLTCQTTSRRRRDERKRIKKLEARGIVAA